MTHGRMFNPGEVERIRQMKNQLKPTKYRVVGTPSTEGAPYWYVIDMDNKTICACDREYNAKIIWKLLEKFT